MTARKISIVSSTKPVYIRKQRVTRKWISDTHKEAISTQKPKHEALRIASEIDFPKVRTFLESVARGSKNSKCSYEIGLKHLQWFLNSSSSNNIHYYQKYNIETILPSLQCYWIALSILSGLLGSRFIFHVSHQIPESFLCACIGAQFLSL